MNIFEQNNDVVGRKKIYTDKVKIDKTNILDILANAVPIHEQNVGRMKYLLNYEKGIQPLQRKKKVRKEIDVKCVDNLAHLITNFKTSYEFGNTITLIQRGERDSGKSNESLGISMLNECFASESVTKVQQEIARYVEICGIGYSYIDFKKNRVDGDSFFSYCSLNPLNTFIIRSSYYLDRRPMIAVTYHTDELGNRYYTCITEDNRFEVKNLVELIDGKPIPDKERKYEINDKINDGNPIKNMLGVIPITEWELRPDRVGCFEREIAQMDALNIMESDFINGLDQNVQSIWQANDIEFPKDENGEEVKPKSNDWVMTFTTENGRTPFIKPMTVPYDFKGILDNIVQSRNSILQNACVPQRNDNNGGSTGVAMSDATGWSSAEMSASQVQAMQEASKMNEVKIALRVIHNAPDSDKNNGIFNKLLKKIKRNSIKPLLDLNYSDVAISVKRQKTYEMTVKTNAFATLVSHGVNGLHAIKEINFFSDPSQVWEDSKDGITKYQKSIYDKTNSTEKNLDNRGVAFKGEGGMDENKANRGDRQMGDESDQVNNSNNIDGIKA